MDDKDDLLRTAELDSLDQDALIEHVRNGMQAGTIRFELQHNWTNTMHFIRAEVADPVHPRRQPKRLFPLADLLIVSSYGDGLRMLADLFDAAEADRG